MESVTRGNAAEGAILAAFVQRGYGVLVPFGGGQPYENAWSSGGCLVFNARGTDHGNGCRSYRGLADVFGVYFPRTNGVYLVPISEIASAKGYLRVEPPRNNQKQGVRFASDFAIDKWTRADLRRLAAECRTTPELEGCIA